MAQTYRTFVAVEIPTDVSEQAVRLVTRLNRTSAKVTWVESENLHVTLKFLGEVEATFIPDVCKAVRAVVANQSGFELELGGVGAFPNTSRPRTIWLGVTKGLDEMIALHDAVNEALANLGFRGENRRFVPHLTIGRVKQPSGTFAELSELITKHEDFVAGKLPVDEVAIVSSKLEREGPIYTILGHATLA